MGIREIHETTESCKHCYMCRHACPTFLATKLDSHTPRGYALLLSEIEHGLQCFTPAIVDRFYQCSQCGLCREDCAYRWAEDELVRNGREEIVRQEKAPQRVQAIVDTIMVSGTPYEKPASTADFSSAKKEAKGSEVLYFAGCSTRQHHSQIISSVDKVLGALGTNWTVLEEEGCCGAPLWELGYSQEARNVAAVTAEKIRDLEPEILLTGCPHCARAFSEFYPVWDAALPSGMKIMHTSQYFDLLLSEEKLELAENELPPASYHDPCQLGRKLGEYEAPRRLIEAATGKKPIELFHSRGEAECCGAGSVMFLTDHEIANKVAARRLAAAGETEARLLVTSCQNCKQSLCGGDGNKSIDVEVLDIVEVLARCMQRAKPET